MICIFGFSLNSYLERLPFLHEDPLRKLIFVEDAQVSIPTMIKQDPQVLLFTINTFWEIEIIAYKIACISALYPLEIVQLKSSAIFQDLSARLTAQHLHLSSRLCDGADFGKCFAKNAIRNLKKSFRSFLPLKNACKNIPAILVGAGPSLEKDSPFLEQFRSKALIFAGGGALEKIGFFPHAGAILDPKSVLQKNLFPQIPVFFQARVESDNLDLFSGPRVLVPESHFPFLNWFSRDETLFDTGWTVGTMLVQIATFLGCNPIVVSGMDFCYRDQTKYAYGERVESSDLIKVKNRKNEDVLTQNDWLLAVKWLNDCKEKHPSVEFFNTADNGLKFFDYLDLKNFDLPILATLEQNFLKQVVSLPEVQANDFALWQKLLVQTQAQLNSPSLESNDVVQTLLNPLWEIWKIVFEREDESLFLDPLHLSCQKNAFFDQVISEHLNVFHE